MWSNGPLVRHRDKGTKDKLIHSSTDRKTDTWTDKKSLTGRPTDEYRVGGGQPVSIRKPDLSMDMKHLP